jgi:hypothetical protein
VHFVMPSWPRFLPPTSGRRWWLQDGNLLHNIFATDWD